MDCFPKIGNQENVVFTVFWRAEATDGTHTTAAFNSQGIAYSADTSFTPYDQLTEDQVIGWVRSAMTFTQAENIEASLARGIEDMVNPPIVTPPLPWA
jgi:hypothetical protein